MAAASSSVTDGSFIVTEHCGLLLPSVDGDLPGIRIPELAAMHVHLVLG